MSCFGDICLHTTRTRAAQNVFFFFDEIKDGKGSRAVSFTYEMPITLSTLLIIDNFGRIFSFFLVNISHSLIHLNATYLFAKMHPLLVLSMIHHQILWYCELYITCLLVISLFLIICRLHVIHFLNYDIFVFVQF